jgi:hypothetical protein
MILMPSSKRHRTFFVLEPFRVFVALMIAVASWFVPVLFVSPQSQPLNSSPGISLVYAGSSMQACSRSCQIQVCVRWIPEGPGCSNPGPGGGCCTDYETECDPGCEPPPPPILPPSISANLNCSSWGDNGWCAGSLSIDLSASDPQGEAVIISGSLSGNAFACPAGDTACSIALNNEGTGTVSYVVNSATGLSSNGSTSYKRDVTTPQIDGSFSGVAGSNGWYVSDVDLNASASDLTSGLASFDITLDGGSSTTYADITLSDGIHTVLLSATDNAGNTTEIVQAFNIDTITPNLNLAISGTTGAHGWYRSSVHVTASASDAGSGVAQVEASKNGGAWFVVGGPVSFTNGHHTYQFRTTDNAGNLTETPVQEIYVDGTGPDIQLVEETSLGETVYYEVQDPATGSGEAGSGLVLLQFVIEDDDERFAKIVWQEDITGNYYDGGVLWDGKFNGAQAPAGMYTLTIKARDTAGNETRKISVVTVDLLSFLMDIPTFNPPSSPLPLEEAPVEESLQNEEESALGIAFGGTITSRSENEYVKTDFLAPSTTNPITATDSSNILWGAAAAALVGATLAEWQKKREEEAAAKAAADRAAFLARIEKEDAKKGNRILSYKDRAKAYQASLDNFKAGLVANGFSEKEASALKSKAVLGGSIPSVASVVSNRDKNNAMEDKMAREDAAEEARWLAMKAAEEAKKAEELAAAASAAKVLAKPVPPPDDRPWWEKLIDEGTELVNSAMEAGKDAMAAVTGAVNGAIQMGKDAITLATDWAIQVKDGTVQVLDTIKQTAVTTWVAWTTEVVPTATLNRPPNLRPVDSFQQDQMSVGALTGPVECVTTAAVMVRNIVNEQLAALANKPALPDLLVKDFTLQVDALANPWEYRVPSNQPPVPVIGMPIAGWMHPELQLPNTLDYFAAEFQTEYGCSFDVKQSSGNSLDDIADNLQQGNLVIVHGLWEVPTDLTNGQFYLGGAPHTMGPVISIDGNANTVTILDTGSSPTPNVMSVENFEAWWGRQSAGNLYTEPNSMTVVIPDTVCAPPNTPTPTVTSSPTSTPSSTPTVTSSPTNTPSSTPTSTATTTATPSNTPASSQMPALPPNQNP